jgi:hypothetical protein
LLFEHSDLSPLFAYELPQKVAAKKKWCQRPGKINAVEMADINNKWHRQMDEYKPHDRELFVSCSEITTWDIYKQCPETGIAYRQ